MCFIGLIGKEQLPCCISTIFLSSTALAGEAALRAVRGALAVPFFLLRTRKGPLCMCLWLCVRMCVNLCLGLCVCLCAQKGVSVDTVDAAVEQG